MRNLNKERLRRPLLIGGTVLFVGVAAAVYLTGGNVVSTDDAYTQSARAEISANIEGRVTRIDVQDNQQVHKGDPLFELDNRERLIAVEDAKARLAAARLQVVALKATYRERLAAVQSGQENVALQQRERDRQARLAAKGFSSPARLDAAQHVLAEATRQLSAAREELMNARALLGDKPDLKVEEHPSVQQAQAELDRAQLALSYTVIKAPMDGVVSKVDLLQVGDYIKAATPLFALLSGKSVWVEANFKETEVANMHTGQQAVIDVDAYPGHAFHGSVESLSPGTGSSFSILPPENATGNWVKVVQRVPVRISINDAGAAFPLQAGLSAIVTIDTHRSRLKALW